MGESLGKWFTSGVIARVFGVDGFVLGGLTVAVEDDGAVG